MAPSEASRYSRSGRRFRRARARDQASRREDATETRAAGLASSRCARSRKSSADLVERRPQDCRRSRGNGRTTDAPIARLFGHRPGPHPRQQRRRSISPMPVKLCMTPRYYSTSTTSAIFSRLERNGQLFSASPGSLRCGSPSGAGSGHRPPPLLLRRTGPTGLVRATFTTVPGHSPARHCSGCRRRSSVRPRHPAKNASKSRKCRNDPDQNRQFRCRHHSLQLHRPMHRPSLSQPRSGRIDLDQ